MNRNVGHREDVAHKPNLVAILFFKANENFFIKVELTCSIMSFRCSTYLFNI